MPLKKNKPNLLSTGNFGGAHGVMVIIIGNGHGDSSSNPRQD